MSPINPVGQFPGGDRKENLETDSLKALNNILPSDRFHFRDERIHDKGVDGSIELKFNNQSLNARAQVQMKGTDSTDLNQDGSFSLPVDVSNLNYLLQGPSPVYILHINPTNELRLIWARDEAMRLDQESPNWRNQETVTLRFSTILTETFLDEFTQRVFNETNLMRDTITMVLSAKSSGQIFLSVDPNTLQTVNAQIALNEIENLGLDWVSSGKAQETLILAQKATPLISDRPRANLVMAFALVTLGRYSEAHGNLARFQLHLGDSPEEDRQLGAYLSAMCDFNLGRISAVELAQQLDDVASNSDTEFSLMLNLDAARRRAFENQFGNLDELVDAISRIDKSAIASEILKFQANLTGQLLKGIALNEFVADTLSILASRRAMDLTIDPKPTIHKMMSEMHSWEQSVLKLLNDPLAKKNPLAYAEALSLRLQIRFSNSMSVEVFNETTLETLPPGIQEDVIASRKIYEEFGRIEGILRTDAMWANFLEMAGKVEEAKVIATQIRTKAKAIGYKYMEEAAESILSGSSAPSILRKMRTERTEIDEDVRISRHEESEFVDAFADHALETMDLPADRLSHVRESVRGMYYGAKLRVEWCQHFELLENLSHNQTPTPYSEPICWCVRCQVKNIQSNDSSEMNVLVEWFKDRACNDCPSKSPKASL